MKLYILFNAILAEECFYNPVDAICSSPANTICNRANQSIFVGNGKSQLGESYGTFCDEMYHSFYGVVSQMNLYCQPAGSNVRPILKGIQTAFVTGNTQQWGQLHGTRGTEDTVQMNVRLGEDLIGMDFWHQENWGIVGVQFLYQNGQKSDMCGDSMGQKLHVDVESQYTNRCLLKYVSGVELPSNNGEQTENEAGVYGLGLHFDC